MSFPRYPEYKDSGVEWLGEVPGHWNVNQMKHRMRMRMRYGDALASEIREESKIDVFGSNGVVGAHSITNTKAPAIVVGRKGSYGKIVWAENGGFVIDTAYAIDIETTNEDLRWVYFALQPLGLDSLSQDTGVPGLAREKAYSIQIAVPPLVEQQSIATFLDRETAKIDALIAEQQRLIELLKEKRQAVISHAVTTGLNPDVPMKDSGIEWLGEVPEHWSNHFKLNDLTLPQRNSFVNGPFGSDLLAAELIQDGVPVIYIRDLKAAGYARISEWCVTEEKAKQLSFCTVIPGDILVAKVGDPPGLAVLYPTGEPLGVITQDVIRIRVNENIVDQGFLIYLLNSDYGRALIDNISVESTRTRVSLGDYKQLRMIVPPKEEQISIVTFLNGETTKLDTLTTEAQHAIDLLKERRTALISAAVTGKIDVRNHD